MGETRKYVCIHAHFYQPPRENPWLEEVELQDSAHPYHDWNAKITAECYGPNAEARMLDDERFIVSLVNNYSKISHNFGPTLLSWLRRREPEVYQKIIESDAESRQQFSGHGSALAQVYNHMIMPLAIHRDKVTQTYWGIRDFHHRYGRFPEGIWLAETAVDIETLEVLTEQGIKFTILAPNQAAQIRPLGGDAPWENVSGGKVDTSRAYKVNLPSGRSINIFFYSGPTSQAVAFEHLLDNGHNFANKLIHGFGPREGAQLHHIATDGESYGHHHRHGEMALAYALHEIEKNPDVTLTNYGEFLEKHPPEYEARIVENTAWSCAHGVERWRSGCGCNSGGKPGWHQDWRGPLRKAFDWLRDQVDPLYDQAAKEYFEDPWKARNEYIEVLVDRSEESIDRFLKSYCKKAVEDTERTRALELLEIQRQRLLMYTSCAWFFDEISGIETVQCLKYAVRVLQLVQKVFGRDLDAEFAALLKQARSNIGQLGTGDQVFERYAKRSKIDVRKVAAHYAVSSIFEHPEEYTKIFAYEVKLHNFERREAGRAGLILGAATVRSVITLEQSEEIFSAVHFGDHNISAGVKATREGEYQALRVEAIQAFDRVDFPQVIRTLDAHFKDQIYSIKDLFADSQRKIVDRIMHDTISEVENGFSQLYGSNVPTIAFLANMEVPFPKVFREIVDFSINREFINLLSSEESSLGELQDLVGTAERWNVALNQSEISVQYGKLLNGKIQDLTKTPEDESLAHYILQLVKLGERLPFECEFGTAQNTLVRLRESEAQRTWTPALKSLANELKVRF